MSELLNEYRQKVILPTYLLPEQRQKIYNKRSQKFLENDPVTMEIDGVVHKFRYTDVTTDLPSTYKTWTNALRLMQTPADFANVRPLLEGLTRARRTITPQMKHRVIRWAEGRSEDSLQTVLDTVRGVRHTGFRLNSSELVAQLLVALQRPAIASGWAADETRRAVKRVRIVLDMLETDRDRDREHAPAIETAGEFPFFRDPQMLAYNLHVVAAVAVHHRGGVDNQGIVARYAAQMVALWPEGAGLLDLQPDEAYADQHRMKYLLDRNIYLWYGSPVLNALQMAAGVVEDPELKKQLESRAASVEAEVKAALDSPNRKRGGRGEEMYNELFNPQPKESQPEE